MHIIIDGYNLLRSQDSLSEKEFLKSLQQYASIKKHNISIIFDGGSMPWPSEEKTTSLNIIYAGGGHSADNYIIYRIKEGYYKPENTLFVSSDRELIDCATKRNIACIGSYEFWPFIQRTLSEQRQQPKQYKNGNQIIRKKDNSPFTDFDQFMMKASQKKMLKEERSINYRSLLQNKKLSRLDRKLIDIIEKL